MRRRASSLIWRRKDDSTRDFASVCEMAWIRYTDIKHTRIIKPNLSIINDMVEAAGVEPDISVENTQLTDSGYASFAGNAIISKSTVRSLYSDCQQFPEPQPSDLLLLLQMRDTLKCSATFIHQTDPANRRYDQFCSGFSLISS
jgi:hypothetical protein